MMMQRPVGSTTAFSIDSLIGGPPQPSPGHFVYTGYPMFMPYRSVVLPPPPPPPPPALPQSGLPASHPPPIPGLPAASAPAWRRAWRSHPRWWPRYPAASPPRHRSSTRTQRESSALSLFTPCSINLRKFVWMERMGKRFQRKIQRPFRHFTTRSPCTALQVRPKQNSSPLFSVRILNKLT